LKDATEAIDLRDIVASLGETGGVQSPVVVPELTFLLAHCDYVELEGDFAHIKVDAQNQLRTVFEAVDGLLDRRLSKAALDNPVGPSDSPQKSDGVLEGLDDELARQRAKPPGQKK
jgi:hypothetical protein